MIRPLSGNPKPTMSKAKEAIPVEPTVIVNESTVSSETDLDVLTDEIVSEFTEEATTESDAIETVIKGNPTPEEIEEALKIHDEFLSRNYDGTEEPIPSELEIFVHGMRLLADRAPLSSKINRLLDEVESAFRF